MTELQGRLLKLIKIFGEICDRHGITYYLTAGSLLGAIRHKGFIPWDDDVDILMTRDNWEKFLKEGRADLPDGIVVNTQYDDINLATPVGHITETDNTVLYRFHVSNPELCGVLLEIIIIDPVPADEEAGKQYVRDLMTHSDLTNLYYHYGMRIDETIGFEKYWDRVKKEGKEKVLADVDKTSFGYSDSEAAYYVQRFAGAPHFWPKELFGTPRIVPFEDIMVPVPEHAEECLSIGFDDDWMYVPEGGDEKSTHEFCTRSYSVPSQIILDDYEKHVERDDIENLLVERRLLLEGIHDLKMKCALDMDEIAIAHMKMVYEEKLSKTDISSMLESGDYEGIQDFFQDYLDLQCNSMLIGSSSLKGWKRWWRKNNPVLIDIGDEALYAVLRLFLQKSQLRYVKSLLKARHRIERPLTNDLKYIESIYEATKKIMDSYSIGDYNNCRKLVDNWKNKVSDNPRFIVYDVLLDIHEKKNDSSIIEKINNGLKITPNNEVLLCAKAELLLSNNPEESLKIYKWIIENGHHGLVLTHIKEVMENDNILSAYPEHAIVYYKLLNRLGYETNNVGENSSDNIQKNQNVTSLYEEQIKEGLSEAQKARFNLLCELDKICKDNGLTYYMGGKILLQAAQVKRYIDRNGYIEIFMDTENLHKFTKIVKENYSDNRFIDSMETNPLYHRLCVKYCDRNTIDYSVLFPNEKQCIFVTIEVLRHNSRNKFINRYLNSLELGWETLYKSYRNDKKARNSSALVKTLIRILGRQRAANYIYRKLTTEPKQAELSRYRLKYSREEPLYYPAKWFQNTDCVSLENNSFMTMGSYEDYLAKKYGKKWKERIIGQKKLNTLRRIVDANHSAEELCAYLKREGIDNNKIWEQWRELNGKSIRITQINSELNRYWYLLTACVERYIMAEQFQPQKTHLREMYDGGEKERLRKDLKDLIIAVRKYLDEDIALSIDPEIDEMILYLMKKKDAANYRRLLNEQGWMPISMFENNSAN